MAGLCLGILGAAHCVCLGHQLPLLHACSWPQVCRQGLGNVALISTCCRTQDLQERIDTNMTEACAKITPRTAFLIVHGDQDQSVPVSNAGQYHKAVPGSQLEIVQDADHNFRHAQHRQLLIDKVIEFMQRKVDQSVL